MHDSFSSEALAGGREIDIICQADDDKRYKRFKNDQQEDLK